MKFEETLSPILYCNYTIQNVGKYCCILYYELAHSQHIYKQSLQYISECYRLIFHRQSIFKY